MPLLAAFFVLCLAGAARVRRLRGPLGCLLLGGVLGLALVGCTAQQLDAVQTRYAGRTVRLTAEVEQVTARYAWGRVRAVLRTETADGRAAVFRLVCTSLPECAAGERVEGEFALETPARAEATGFYADGVALLAEGPQDFRVVGESRSFRARTARVQQRLSRSLRRWLDEDTGGVLAAMVVGDRTALPRELSRAYRAAGLAHVLVVSGMHVSILCGGALPRLRLRSKRRRERSYAGRRLGALARAGVALLLVGITGVTPSVQRAAVAVWASALGVWLYGPPDALTSLAAAGLLMTLPNSYAVCDVGFELSFAAVLGTLAGGALVRRMRRARHTSKRRLPRALVRFGRSLSEAACISLCASAATFPVLVLRGLSVSLYSLLSSVAVLWLVQPVLTLGMAAAFSGLLPACKPLHKAFSFCAGLLAWGLNGWARMVSGWQGAQLWFDTAYAALVWLILLGLCALALRSRVRLRVALPALVLVAAVAAGTGSALNRDVVRVELAGGANTPAAVFTQNGEAVVLFRGGEATQEAVEEVLARRGVRRIALLVDLRMQPEVPCTLPAARVVQAAGMRPNTVRLLECGTGISVEVLRARQGCLTRVVVGGERFVTQSGTVRLAKPIRTNWLLASPSRPDTVRWGGLLTLSTRYRWMDPEADYRTVRTLTLRPGGGTRLSG